jgi:hypothetical protein
MKFVGKVLVMILLMISMASPAVYIGGYFTGKCVTVDNPLTFILDFKGTGGATTFACTSSSGYFMGYGRVYRTDTTKLNYPMPEWQGTVTPRATGFVFTPASMTYGWVTTTYQQDYIAKDTMKPIVTLAPITSQKLGDSINILSTIVDNSYMVIKFRYSYSVDSGKTFTLIDTFLPTHYWDKDARDSISCPPGTFSKMNTKSKKFLPLVVAQNYQIKTEVMDADSNWGVGYSNIFSVVYPTSIKSPRNPMVSSFTTTSMYTEGKIYDVRGRVLTSIGTKPLIKKTSSLNGKKVFLNIK